MSEKEFLKGRILCHGKFLYTNGKKGVKFEILTGDNYEIRSGNMFHFDFKKHLDCNPGSVYEVDVSEDGIRGTPKYMYAWGNEEERGQIQLEAKAQETVITMASQEKNDRYSDEAMLAVIEPLRSMYWNTNVQGRVALIARVISLMQRGY